MKNEEDISISFKTIINTLKHYGIIICLFIVVITVITHLAVMFGVKDQYTSTSKILITGSSNTSTISNISSILKTKKVIGTALEDYKLDEGAVNGVIANTNLTTNDKNTTQVANITVISNEVQKAHDYNIAITDELVKTINSINLNAAITNDLVESMDKLNFDPVIKVEILDSASMPTTPSNKPYAKYDALAAAATAVIFSIIFYVREDFLEKKTNKTTEKKQ